MTVLPAPVALDEPPGTPETLDHTAADLAGAARHLDELATALATTSAPGWRGADADALAARCQRVSSVAVDVSHALGRAARRCAEHAELWRATRGRIAALRDEQARERAYAQARVALPFDAAAPTAAGPDDVLAELAASEDRRRSEHGALRARLAEDAELTAGVLTSAAADVGVRGGSAGSAATVASLAARLPGWGAPQLARLGRRLGEELLGNSADVEALAQEALTAATGAAHASAMLTALGPDGVRWLLGWVAAGHVPPDGALVRLLAASLADLGRSGGPAWLGDLLADAGDAVPVVVPGLAAVLAVSRRHGVQAAPAAVLVAWGRSLLAAERATGVPAGAHPRPVGSDPSTADPVALVVEAVLRSGAPESAAELLQRSSDWTALLSRGWDDWGELLGELVVLAAAAPPEQARTALRSGLVALGTGLADGHADGWPAWDLLVAGLAPSLMDALGRHVDVLTAPLWVGATGVVDPVSELALRGLSRLSVEDLAAFARLTGALERSVALRPGALGALPDHALPVIVLPAALVAVNEHGWRLLHAVRENAAEDAAASRAAAWDHSIGLLLALCGGRGPLTGMVVGAAEAGVTRLTGFDGHRVSRPDVGPRLSHWHAVARVQPLVGVEDPMTRERVAVEASRAFARTGNLLGVPVPRSTPDVSFWRAVLEGAVPDSLSRSDLQRLRPPGRAAAALVGASLPGGG